MPHQKSPFLLGVGILCESGLLQTKGFVPVPWEEDSLGWMGLRDVGGIVGA